MNLLSLLSLSVNFEIVLYIARMAMNLSLQIDIFLVLGCIKFEKIMKLFQKTGRKIHQQIVH